MLLAGNRDVLFLQGYFQVFLNASRNSREGGISTTAMDSADVREDFVRVYSWPLAVIFWCLLRPTVAVFVIYNKSLTSYA